MVADRVGLMIIRAWVEDGSSKPLRAHIRLSSNTNEDDNSLLGAFSNGAAGINSATAVGNRAQVSQSDSLVLGSIAGVNNATQSVTVGIGTTTPKAPSTS